MSDKNAYKRVIEDREQIKKTLLDGLVEKRIHCWDLDGGSVTLDDQYSIQELQEIIKVMEAFKMLDGE